MNMFKRLLSSFIIICFLSVVANAALLDPVENFAKGTVSTGYDASATSIVLSSGDGANFPSAVSYNVIWWNVSDYSDPGDDPNVEIVRVTARSSDTLTITRAQEGTSASTKNTVGKVYLMINGITKKMIDDIDVNFQPLDADLTVIAALANTDGNFIVGNGSTWVAENGATALTSIGGIGPATTDTLTNKTIDDESNEVHADATYEKVRNVSGSALTAGTPVYASGYNAGQDRTEVEPSEADVVATMPAIGIVEEDIANNTNGHVIEIGVVENIDTTGTPVSESWSVGDMLYVSTTVGTLTNVRPIANSDKVQFIATVTRAHATLGRILVQGAGRANDIPNNLTMVNTGAFRTGTTNADTALLAAYDVDGTAYIIFGTLTAGNTPTFDLNAATTIGNNAIIDSSDIGSSVQAFDAGLLSIAGLATLADKMIYTTASDTYAVTSLTAFARTILDDIDAVTVRTTLDVDASGTDNSTDVTLAGTPDYITILGQVITRGLIDLTTDITGISGSANGGTGNGFTKFIGPTTTEKTFTLPDSSQTLAYSGGAFHDGFSDFVAAEHIDWTGASAGTVHATNYVDNDAGTSDAELSAIAGLTSSADKLPYYTGIGTASLADFTSFARSILDDADAATVRTTLGAAVSGANTDITSLDLGGTTLLASRQITVDTGGGLDINMGTASGDDFTVDTDSLVVEGDTGNVGMGTAIPKVLFHVLKNGAATNIQSNTLLAIEQSGGSGATAVLGLITDATGKCLIRFGDTDDDDIGRIQYDNANDSWSIFSNALERLKVDSVGNLGLNTTTFNASAVGVLAIANGTAPAAGTANQSYFYARDVSASSEMFTMDESGTETQLSEHASDAPEWLYDQAPGQENVSRMANYFAGEINFVNNDRRNKLIEMTIAGQALPVEKRFKVTETFAEYNARTGSNLKIANWSENQEAYRIARQGEIDDANNKYLGLDSQAIAEVAKITDLEAQILIATDNQQFISLIEEKVATEKKVTSLIRQRDEMIIPTDYIKKQPPKWLRDKGIILN
jgi:hypothetical protein